MLYIGNKKVSPIKQFLPTETLTVTENGEYDVLNYENVNVNVVDMLQARVDETKSCLSLVAYYGGRNPDIVKNLDTSNVTNMASMFNSCSILTSLNLSNFDTSNVTSMASMFLSCANLTSLDLSNFDTSNVTNMSSMFYACYALTSLDLSGFDTSSVRNTSSMFQSCSRLSTVTGTLDLVAVTSTGNMFSSASNLTDISLKNIKIGLSLSSSTLLTINCLINTIKELWDLTGSTSQKLTIGTTNINKLSNTYVKLITPTSEQEEQDPYINNKKPCEVCDSADEGAMLIIDYISSKNWTLA